MGKKRKCRICGCTDEHGCVGGCYWIEEDLCSKCAERLIEDYQTLQHMVLRGASKYLLEEGYKEASAALDCEFGLGIRNIAANTALF